MRSVSSGTIYYYPEDMLGSSRTMVQAGQTGVCYDADFYPFGGERDVVSTCSQNYKFESKERDTETGNDDFGARYYSNRFGRWLSADWSAVPEPVPYADLTNPQTLNLYAMVHDNPETFADVDGHCWSWAEALCNYLRYGVWTSNKEYAQAVSELRWRSDYMANEAKSWGLMKRLQQSTLYTLYMNQAIGAAIGPKYAQRTFSLNFSDEGTFAGKSVAEVAQALRDGDMSPADVPIQYIIRDGNVLVLNTRSAQALTQAGIPPSQWNMVNMTGDVAAEARLTKQLEGNGLTSEGTSEVTPKGAAQEAPQEAPEIPILPEQE